MTNTTGPLSRALPLLAVASAVPVDPPGNRTTRPRPTLLARILGAPGGPARWS